MANEFCLDDKGMFDIKKYGCVNYLRHQFKPGGGAFVKGQCPMITPIKFADSNQMSKVVGRKRMLAPKSNPDELGWIDVMKNDEGKIDMSRIKLLQSAKVKGHSAYCSCQVGDTMTGVPILVHIKPEVYEEIRSKWLADASAEEKNASLSHFEYERFGKAQPVPLEEGWEEIASSDRVVSLYDSQVNKPQKRKNDDRQLAKPRADDDIDKMDTPQQRYLFAENTCAVPAAMLENLYSCKSADATTIAEKDALIARLKDKLKGKSSGDGVDANYVTELQTTIQDKDEALAHLKKEYKKLKAQNKQLLQKRDDDE